MLPGWGFDTGSLASYGFGTRPRLVTVIAAVKGFMTAAAAALHSMIGRHGQ